MSDGNEGFDPCECMWSHEMAMRRLLSLLRQSQSYCTENECLDELPGSLPGSQTPANSFIMMALCWMAVAMILFLIRPNVLRSSNNDKPPRSNGDGPSGPPPTAPDVD